MFNLNWDKSIAGAYYAGIDRGVFQVHGSSEVVPWSGLVSVEESSESSEPNVSYFDGIRTINHRSRTEYKAQIKAYYTPPEFDPCDGSVEDPDAPGLYSTNNSVKKFNFSYRSMIGESDYRLHFVYNAIADPTDRTHSTIGSVKEPDLLSWDITTNVDSRTGVVNTHFYLDTTKTRLSVVKDVEEYLYGYNTRVGVFPTYEQLKTRINSLPSVVVTDNGDGTWTIDGPDSVVRMTSEATQQFLIDWPGVVIVNDDIYTISE